MKYLPINYYEYNNNKEKYMIMLHGWGCNGKIFDKYVEDFSYDYNIIVFDLYGFGQSIDPKPFFDTYEYAVQIYLFLKSRNIDNIDIFAHSFGGRIALILSAVFNIGINHMILTGSAGLRPRRNIIYYIKLYAYKLSKQLRLRMKIQIGSRDYKNASISMRRVFVRIVNQHLDYLLGYVDCNVLLIWGGKDKETPLYMYYKLKKKLKNVTGYVVQKSEHFCAFTHMYMCNIRAREFLKNG